MTGACWTVQTALIAIFLSATLVRNGLGQTDIQNGGIAYVTEGFNAELLWTYTLSPGITPLFETWRKLPDTGIASRTGNTYISKAYQGRIELFGESGMRLKNVTTADSGIYQLYIVSSDGTSQALLLTLQVVVETTPESTTTTQSTTLTVTQATIHGTTTTEATTSKTTLATTDFLTTTEATTTTQATTDFPTTEATTTTPATTYVPTTTTTTTTTEDTTTTLTTTYVPTTTEATTTTLTTIAPCGGTLTAPPGGTVTHNTGGTCEWTITVEWPSVVLLTFHNITLDYFEYLTIHDGGSYWAPELKSILVNDVIPDPITSTSNQMFVRFTYYIAVSPLTFQRFEFSYSSTDITTTTTTEAATTSAPCGGALMAPPGGTVTVESPNYPVYYDGRASCEWTINVNWPRVVLLTFHRRFHLWTDDEHLTIYDGGSDDAPLLQSITGYHAYINPITSTSNQMFVKLTSSIRFELSGFQFSYSDTAPTTTTLATTHISTTPTVATTTTTTTDVPTTTTEATTTTLATTIVPTTTTYATTLATTTPTPCTVLLGENDIYLLDDGITEVAAGEDARLNWTYSLRVDSAILLEDWKDPDGNYIMRRIGGVVFENHEYKGRVSLIGDSSLLLNGTGPADTGSYTLTAYLCDVSKHEAERKLIIQYAPKLPRIEVTPGFISTEGDTLILQATADCVPPATYTWNRLGGSLPTTAVVNTTLGTLTITEATVEDSGVYTVVAENYLGNSSVKNITVEVGPIPIIGEVAFVASTAVIDGGGPAVNTGQHITPRPVNQTGLLTTLEIVLIALGLTLLVTVLLVGGLRFWWVKKKRARAGRDGGRWYFHPFILDRVYPLAEQPPPPVPARPQFLKYEVDRQDLELGEQIGRGAFGVVYKAVLKRTAAGLVTNRTVVVKTVQDGASVEERVTFVREIETTINLGEHKNLLGLVGCCTLANPPYLVTEYLPYGDLKNLLLKCRQPEADELNSVYHMTDLKMYQIGRQIANGMVFISDAGYVHGDLAARNVLVGKDLLVKIADCGLATDVYERGYQRQDAEQKIPVRWMAPERLLREGRYTSRSDVWSFGVVLYEIATLGDVPYPSLGSTLLEELRRGRREQRPQRCPWELYNMMLSCWQWEEFNRPDFQQLYLELDRLVETNADVSYLKLSSAPSGNEKSSGDIFNAGLASCHHSLEPRAPRQLLSHQSIFRKAELRLNHLRRAWDPRNRKTLPLLQKILRQLATRF